MSIIYTSVPFSQCDSDSQTVDATGGTIAALFTNLALTTCREILIQNRGSVNVLVGKTTAAARWAIIPGGIMAMSPRDLSAVSIKAASATATVDIFVVI